MTTGIYMIKNKTNDKIYIGQSVNIQKRWQEHKNSLNNGKHPNIHLQRAWNKYGEDNFLFQMISYCNHPSLLNNLEKYFINKFDSYNNGYNQTLGGDGGCLGYHHTNESKKIMSEKKMGRQNPTYGKKGSQHPASKCNSSGVANVYKSVQGWTYYYNLPNGKQKRLTNKDPQTLKTRVLNNNLLWDVVNEEQAKINNLQ